MNAKSLLLATAIATAAGAAMAEELSTDTPFAGSTLTRIEVKSAVLQARAAGELAPAGEGVSDKPDAIVSTVPRATVKNEVLAARASGQLVPAGEGYVRFGPELTTPSALRRSQVKAEAIAARQAAYV